MCAVSRPARGMRMCKHRNMGEQMVEGTVCAQVHAW
jgi:hypothetical protein